MVNWNLMTLLTTKLLLPLGLCFSVSFHLARIYFTSIYFRKILFSLWPEDVHVFFQDRYAHRELIPINKQISSVSQADVSVITMWLDSFLYMTPPCTSCFGYFHCKYNICCGVIYCVSMFQIRRNIIIS